MQYIIRRITPDYSRGIAISNNWTCVDNGIIIGDCQVPNDWPDCYIYINGTVVIGGYSRASGTGDAFRMIGMSVIKKGNLVNWSGSCNVYFYPFLN